MEWKLYSFIVRSEQRKLILTTLKKPKTPTEIAKISKLSTSHVSRTLAEFLEKGIVRCLTPNEKVGKIYILTEEGEGILKILISE